MCVSAPVEENKQTRPRMDHRAVPFDRRDAVGILVVSENEFTARASRVIGEEEKASKRV